MIGRRTLVEVLHIVIGVAGAAVIAWGASWSLPHAASTIWAVIVGVMLVTVLMGLSPLRAAWEADRAEQERRG